MNHKIKKRLLGCCIVAAIALLGIGSLYCFFGQNSCAAPPTMSVGIRELEVEGRDISLQWIVKNASGQMLTFDENQIVQAELNGKQMGHPTEFTSVAPSEEIVFILTLTGVDTSRINNLKISATSNEGAKGTIKETIYPPKTGLE